MKQCYECGKVLTPETRSKHQPKIRCLECFAKFASGVEDVLSGKADHASPRAEKERQARFASISNRKPINRSM